MIKKNYLMIFSLIAIIILLIMYFAIDKNDTNRIIDKIYQNPIKVNQEYKDYIYTEYEDHVTITIYNGSDKVLKIPNKINGKPVYGIDDSAFYGNNKIEKVIIPSNVIYIGHQSFIGNDNLKEVVLPDNIVEIGTCAFDVCPKLEAIYVKKNTKSEKALKKTVYKKYLVNKKMS